MDAVGRMVAQNVSRWKEKIEQQQFLCRQDKEKVVQMLVRKPPYFLNSFFFQDWVGKVRGGWMLAIIFLTALLLFCRRSTGRIWIRSWLRVH